VPDAYRDPEVYFKRFKNDGRRVLIVTEAIYTGKALRRLVALLRERNWEVDIAAIGIEGEGLIADEVREDNIGRVEIFSGKYQRNEGYDIPHTPRVYQRPDISGVYKNTRGVIESRPFRNLVPEEKRKSIQSAINQSRHDANIVVDHLMDWYKSQKK